MSLYRIFNTDKGNEIPRISMNSKNTINGRKIIVTGGMNLNAIKNIANAMNSKHNISKEVSAELMGGISLGI